MRGNEENAVASKKKHTKKNLAQFVCFYDPPFSRSVNIILTLRVHFIFCAFAASPQHEIERANENKK